MLVNFHLKLIFILILQLRYSSCLCRPFILSIRICISKEPLVEEIISCHSGIVIHGLAQCIKS